MLYGIISLLLLASAAVVVYNRLIALKVRVNEGWSNIDVQLKRRFDLISRLADTVRGYAAYEKSMQEKITELRGKAGSYSNMSEKSRTENDISQFGRSILALAEAYPDLKANAGFLDLQKNISEVEDQLQYARRYYNGAVRDYNVKIATFPSNIMAGPLKFAPAEFFELESAAEKAPQNIDLA